MNNNRQDQEKLIKLLVKEMLEQDEELNEILGSEMIGNLARGAAGAVQRGVGIAQGLKQNVKQSWKAATGNEAEAKAALDAKSKIKFDFLDKQSEIVKTDVQNAVKNAITKANSIAQSSGAPENKDLNKQYISQKMIQGFGVGSSMSDSDVLLNFGQKTTDSAKQQVDKLKQQFLNPNAAGAAGSQQATAGSQQATAGSQQATDGSQQATTGSQQADGAKTGKQAQKIASTSTQSNTQNPATKKDFQKRYNSLKSVAPLKQDVNWNNNVKQLAKDLGIKVQRSIDSQRVFKQIDDKLKTMKENVLNNKNLSLNEIVDLINYLY